MVLSIPCRDGAIRVYERAKGGGYEPQVEYRAAFWTASTKKRLWGAWAPTIRSTLASLLPKMKLKQAEKDALWAEALIVTEEAQPAMNHKSLQDRPSSDVVFFKSYPFEGIVRTRVRDADSKVRLAMSRAGHTRVNSNWHTTSREALKNIQAKCRTMGARCRL